MVTAQRNTEGPYGIADDSAEIGVIEGAILFVEIVAMVIRDVASSAAERCWRRLR